MAVRHWCSSRELHEQRPVTVDAQTAVIMDASSGAGGAGPANPTQDIQVPHRQKRHQKPYIYEERCRRHRPRTVYGLGAADLQCTSYCQK